MALSLLRLAVPAAAGRWLSTAAGVLKPKRFFKHAEVAQVALGYTVTLDGKMLRTPAGVPLSVPTFPLALSIAWEWQGQHGRIRPHTMPMMTLACTAIDRTPKLRERMIEELVAFLPTDTVCCRDPTSKTLYDEMARVWDPLVAFVAQKYDAPLRVSGDIGGAEQPAAALQGIARALARMDSWTLTAADQLAQTSKSVVVALCVVDRHLTAEQALDATNLEQQLQVKEWGEVEGGHDVDRLDTLVRLSSADAFLRLLGK